MLNDFSNVSKTLFIPLYGRAQEKYWPVGFSDPLAISLYKGVGENAPIKFLPFTTVNACIQRGFLIDQIVEREANKIDDFALVQLGAGLCTRWNRIDGLKKSFEVDFNPVMTLKENLLKDHSGAKPLFIGHSILNEEWAKIVSENWKGPLIICLEGVSMYLKPSEFDELLAILNKYFEKFFLIADVIHPLFVKIPSPLRSVTKLGASFSLGIGNLELWKEKWQDYAFKEEGSLVPGLFAGPLRIVRPLSLIGYRGYRLISLSKSW